MVSGSLIVVGTGIGVGGQITQEAKAHIEQAAKVVYLVADAVTGEWIQNLNPSAESLYRFYGADKERLTTYLEMTERILECVRNYSTVCAVFYGHPGVFVFPSHEAISRARAEGHNAKMLAAVSAEDCLFADLGIDPGRIGCQSFEATDFLVHRRRFDPTSGLILWQIGVIGQIDHRPGISVKGLQILSDTLETRYGSDHQVVVYEAAQYPVCDPVIETIFLRDLPKARISSISTLYVPPKSAPILDLEMVERLGIPKTYIRRRDEQVFAFDPLRLPLPQFPNRA